MYKIMYPYNKFVWEKKKTSKHPNKIHISQKYTIKKLSFQNCVRIKKKIYIYIYTYLYIYIYIYTYLLKMENP